MAPEALLPVTLAATRREEQSPARRPLPMACPRVPDPATATSPRHVPRHRRSCSARPALEPSFPHSHRARAIDLPGLGSGWFLPTQSPPRGPRLHLRRISRHCKPLPRLCFIRAGWRTRLCSPASSSCACADDLHLQPLPASKPRWRTSSSPGSSSPAPSLAAACVRPPLAAAGAGPPRRGSASTSSLLLPVISMALSSPSRRAFWPLHIAVDPRRPPPVQGLSLKILDAPSSTTPHKFLLERVRLRRFAKYHDIRSPGYAKYLLRPVYDYVISPSTPRMRQVRLHGPPSSSTDDSNDYETCTTTIDPRRPRGRQVPCRDPEHLWNMNDYFLSDLCTTTPTTNPIRSENARFEASVSFRSCEDSFDYIRLSSSWTRSSSLRDLSCRCRRCQCR
ncbi:hypothetical protein VPH35_078502 [Triticum aestivum]